MDPNKAPIYFLRGPTEIISKHWNEFKHIFDNDIETFNLYIKNINKSRADAYAKDIFDDEMSEFRISASKIENRLKIS